jgi:hypothetical protein
MKLKLLSFLLYLFYLNIFCQTIPYNSEFCINSNSPTALEYSITLVSSGNFVITWYKYYNEIEQTNVYAQIFNSQFEKVNEEFCVNSYTSSSQLLQEVCGLTNGNFVISWVNWPEGEINDELKSPAYAQIFNENGKKIGEEFPVYSNKNFYEDQPHIAKLSNGGFVICWAENYSEIFAQVFNNSGDKSGAEFKVNTESVVFTDHIAITNLLNEGFIIA